MRVWTFFIGFSASFTGALMFDIDINYAWVFGAVFGMLYHDQLRMHEAQASSRLNNAENRAIKAEAALEEARGLNIVDLDEDPP